MGRNTYHKGDGLIARTKMQYGKLFLLERENFQATQRKDIGKSDMLRSTSTAGNGTDTDMRPLLVVFARRIGSRFHLFLKRNTSQPQERSYEKTA